MGDLTVRQYGTKLEDIRADHVKRYQFALDQLYEEDQVLDAACGVGYGSWLLQRKCDVTGIDISDHAIQFAKKYWSGPHYLKADLQETRIGQYDAIVSFETLEHLVDPETVLYKFRASTDLLIASVPNEELYPFNADKFKDDPYPHLRHYTPDEFEYLLNRANFEVVTKHCQKSKHGEVESGTDGMFLIYVCR